MALSQEKVHTIEDIYALPDGSYLLLKDGREELHGEAWLISDGEIRLINRENQVLVL